MIDFVYIALQGDRFSPAEAEQATGLKLSDKKEVGQLGDRGRYKGQPVPYGAARLIAPEDVLPYEKLTWVLDAALPHIAALRKLGAERAEVWIVEHFDGQMNMSYEPAELEKLARLGFPLCVSCYEVEQRLGHEMPSEPAG